MVEIVEVKTKKQQKEFVNFPIKLYKGNPYYVPSLYMDEINMFNKKGTYFDVTKCIYYLAYKDGKLVGRIQGINQLAYNKMHNSHQIRFGRFDSIDDQEVANALFDAVVKWGKETGMDTLLGPLGFSDFEREGLLIEGFDQPQTFEEQYNYPYYQKLIENYGGFVKDVDWIEFQLRKAKNLNPRFHALGDRILKMNHLKMVDINKYSRVGYIKTYSKVFFELVEETYADIYEVCPFTEKSKKALVDEITLLLDKKYLRVITDENDNAVAFCLILPSLSEAIKKSNGHLTPRCIFNVLRAVKKPKVIDLLLVGVKKEYRNKGIPAVFLDLLNQGFDEGVEHYETNLNLETNTEIISCWKYFDAFQNKKRRCYKMLLKAEEK